MIDLKDMPARMARLPLDSRGYPIPKFVKIVDGKPDFRQTDARHLGRCLTGRNCWICGERLGKFIAFVCGPTAIIQRVTSEPASHRECALFALRICPFMLFANRPRDDSAALAHKISKSLVMIQDNPGLWLLYTTQTYSFRPQGDAIAIHIGTPDSLEWFKQGRGATADEVAAVIKERIALLRERTPPTEHAELEIRITAADKLLTITGVLR